MTGRPESGIIRAMDYLALFGSQPHLSRAEWEALIPGSVASVSGVAALIQVEQALDPQSLIDRLGGTLKIAARQTTSLSPEHIADELLRRTPEGKVVYGLSYYGRKADRALGMQIKRLLKEQGRISRLVTSRETALSPVVVVTNKVCDIIITPQYWGVTEAVHDYHGFSRRDYDRPAVDARSGMMPIKLARMMLNLAGVNTQTRLLDPMCGSGTIITEACVIGVEQVTGSDLSDRAVTDTQSNIDWLTTEYGRDYSVELLVSDIRQLPKRLGQSYDAIVTESYLGPALNGRETPERMMTIARDLSKLYRDIFPACAQLLVPGCRLVMTMPRWEIAGRTYNIDSAVLPSDTSMRRIDDGSLIYHHPGQHVRRIVTIWEKRGLA